MSESTSTLPRRWRLLLVVALTFATLTAMTLVFSYAWAHHARSAYNQILDKRLTLPEQAISPESDAGPIYRQALSLLSPAVPPPSRRKNSFDNRPPHSASWWTAAENARRHYAQLLELLQQASQLPTAQWPSEPLALNRGSHLFSEITILSQLLTDLALYAHFTGNTAEALRLVEYQLVLANHLQPPGDVRRSNCRLDLIGQSAYAIRIIMSEAQLDSADQQATARRVMSRLAGSSREDFHAKIASSAQYAAQYVSTVYEGAAIQPLVNLNLVAADHKIDKLLVDTRAAPTLGSAYKLAWGYSPPAVYRAYWTGFYNTIDRVIIADLERQAAAIAIAWRLYEADHHAPPPSLAALAPAYLPTVPTDPFDLAAGPLKLVYRKCLDGNTRPLIYSIGRNNTDDTTTGQSVPPPLDATLSSFADFRQPRDLYLDLFFWNSNGLPPSRRVPDPPDPWLETK